MDKGMDKGMDTCDRGPYNLSHRQPPTLRSAACDRLYGPLSHVPLTRP